jgi:hypothetical protein
MKRTFITGLLLTLLIMLFAGAGDASAAILPHFSWSGETPSSFQVKSSSTQTIITAAGTIECGKALLKGTIKSVKMSSLTAQGKYSECKAFGDPATISGVEYEFHAAENISLAGPITVSVPKLGCTIKIEGSTGKVLKPWFYSNSKAGVLAVSAATGISSSVEGGKGECGSEKEKDTGGEYSGELFLADTSTGTLKAEEGEAGKFEGEGKEGGIAAGNASANGMNGHVFRFGNHHNFRDLQCNTTFTWAAQAGGATFDLTPSYPSCTYNGGAATLNVGATCLYRFNGPPTLVSNGANGNVYRERFSLRGTGCELKMELENNVCEVKVAGGAANENLNALYVENNNNTGSIIVTLQFRPSYTSRGCQAPIAASGRMEFLGVITLGGIIVR